MAGEASGHDRLAQIIAVVQRGKQRAYVSLDDLERLAKEDSATLLSVLAHLRTVFESWHDRTGGIYINEAEA